MPPDEAMRVRVLCVLLLLLLLLLLLFVHAGVCCVASVYLVCVKFGSVLVQVPNRYRFVYSSRNSEVDHLPPIFHGHPRHLGGVFL